ncbi:MAG: hypothetical protein ACHQ49_15320 [Elusimicrobiota bacterium]
MGPRDQSGLSSMIVVRYYPPGDKSFPSAEAYAAAQTQKPLFQLPGDKRGPAAPTTVAGRKARRIVTEHSILYPPNSTLAKRVPMRMEQVVVPAERGFFVLLDDAPRSLSMKNRAAFKSVIAGFRPKL